MEEERRREARRWRREEEGLRGGEGIEGHRTTRSMSLCVEMFGNPNQYASLPAAAEKGTEKEGKFKDAPARQVQPRPNTSEALHVGVGVLAADRATDELDGEEAQFVLVREGGDVGDESAGFTVEPVEWGGNQPRLAL